MKIHSIVAAAALGFIASAAGAETVVVSVTPLPTERVSFADLNLASSAGQNTLKGRIKVAAKRVCIIDGDRSMENNAEGKYCYRAAYRDGLQQMSQAIASRAFGSEVAATTLVIQAK